MSRKIAALGISVVALLLTGCSAVPADPHAVLEEKAAAVDDAAQDLLESLDAAGYTDAAARGIVDACQSEPAPGASFGAGIGVTVGDDLVSAFDSLSTQLTRAGWTATDDFDDADVDPAAPMGRFVRADITLDVKTGGFTSGGTRYGADEMTLGITIADDCVRMPDGAYFSKMRDLEKTIHPRD
ncbi:hypothetical protein ACI3KS_08825 [Microbacterium sp. ZW T5_45]|uniref:hypothetical protein n=1 Tax=Microbacterium sp. ZW T5_45 TaxID=3378080 RepID=UPI0038552788